MEQPTIHMKVSWTSTAGYGHGNESHSMSIDESIDMLLDHIEYLRQYKRNLLIAEFGDECGCVEFIDEQ